MPSNPYAPAPAQAIISPEASDGLVLTAVSRVVAVLAAVLLAVQLWTGLDLQPGPVLFAVEAMTTVQIASWLSVAVAACWGLLAICRLICSAAVTVFTGDSIWARIFTVVSFTALGTGYMTGDVLSGLVISVPAALLSLAFAKRGETQTRPHTLGA